MTVTEESAHAAAQPPVLDARRRNIVFVAVLLGMLLAALDQTMHAGADDRRAEHRRVRRSGHRHLRRDVLPPVHRLPDTEPEGRHRVRGFGGGWSLRAAVDAISKRLLVEDLGDGFSPRRPQPEQAVLAP